MAEQSSADYRGNLGRYALYGEIASGGMATVHLARLLGPVGFARTVAIKRLHPHLSKDPDFVGMFLEEARLAARVRHPNVVATLDVVSDDGELFLVMEYVPGESLSRLVRKSREAGKRIPVRYLLGIMTGALDGLHAAHEATSEKGQLLGLVHRDVSPQNIHVGLDGVSRVLDFGIAKATNRVQETRTDQIKGKVAYMSPEQLAKGHIDRRADIYSACVVLWEALTGQRLFKADDVPSLVYAIINDDVAPPSALVPDLPPGLDAIVMRGLEREAEKRWSSAHELAMALERVAVPAPPREIAGWVVETAGEALAWRQELVHRIESETSSSLPPPILGERPSSPSPEVTSGVRPTDTPPESIQGARVLPAPILTNEHVEARSSASLLPEDERATVHEPAAPGGVAISDEPPSRVGLVAMIIAGVLFVGAAALFGLRWMQLSGDTSAADTARPAESASSEPAVVIEPAQRTATAASSVPPAPAPPPPFVAVPPPQPFPGHARPSPSAHDECENPFTVDARGIRHPKPQCFKR